MSQRKEKHVRALCARMDKLEGRVELLRRWQGMEERFSECLHTIQSQSTAEAGRRREHTHLVRLRAAERELACVLVFTIAVIVLCAILAAFALNVSAPPAPTAPLPTATVALLAPEEEAPEGFENERIEAALLAQGVKLDDVTVTHYDPCVACCGKTDGITASGLQATPGVSVAVDPTVIPLGSDVLVDYGDGEIQYYRADDVGGAVKGKHIDLCVGSHTEAVSLGVRTATVYWCENTP